MWLNNIVKNDVLSAYMFRIFVYTNLDFFRAKNIICWHYEYFLYMLYITISRLCKYCNLKQNSRNLMFCSAFSNFLPILCLTMVFMILLLPFLFIQQDRIVCPSYLPLIMYCYPLCPPSPPSYNMEARLFLVHILHIIIQS